MLKVLALFYSCLYLVKTCSFAYLFRKVVVTRRDFARLSAVDIFIYGKGNMNKNVPTLYYLFGSLFCIYFTSIYQAEVAIAYLIFEIPSLSRLYRRFCKLRQLKRFASACDVVIHDPEKVASALYLENKVYGSSPMNTDAIRAIFKNCYAILTKDSNGGVT